MIPAVRMAAEIRRGDRSARDTVAGSLTTIEAQQERLNTSTLIDTDRALERADQIDRAVEQGDEVGPLAGVPIALKDIIDHDGRVTTAGSAFYRHEADHSATVVERLEAAGAIIVSRTGLHEFAWGFSSENPWFGPVRNPYDQTLSPGGSSGGSGVAVAAEQVPIAIGTDTGGSVRVPAALCGVYGLKVTHGRISLAGVFPLAPSLDTVGPIAATVGDLAVAYRVIAGYDSADPWSAPKPVVSPSGEPPDLTGTRLGIPVNWLDEAPATDEVASAYADAVAAMRGLGATTVEIDDQMLKPSPMIMSQFAPQAQAIHRTWRDEDREYGPEMMLRFEDADAVTVDEYVASHAWRSHLRHRAAVAFDACDLIVTPATAGTRKVIGVDTMSTPHGDIPYRTALSWFTALVNHIGAPALVGPIPDSGRPPVGLQIVAPWWREHRLLEVASLLERTGLLGTSAAEE